RARAPSHGPPLPAAPQARLGQALVAQLRGTSQAIAACDTARAPRPGLSRLALVGRRARRWGGRCPPLPRRLGRTTAMRRLG
ncbi:MAG TPA: hypothetical protein VIH59_26120, partial [Candidatus Tectomicrobia bacterium]